MSTRIRLARGGKKKAPYYRIVVAEKRSPRDGRFIERLGSYDPALKDRKVSLDAERARYWLGSGAVPSETVRKLLELHGFKFNTKGNLESFTPVAELPELKDRKAKPSKKAQARQAAAAEAEAEAAAAKAAAAATPAEEPKAEAAPAEEPKAEAAEEKSGE